MMKAGVVAPAALSFSVSYRERIKKVKNEKDILFFISNKKTTFVLCVM